MKSLWHSRWHCGSQSTKRQLILIGGKIACPACCYLPRLSVDPSSDQKIALRITSHACTCFPAQAYHHSNYSSGHATPTLPTVNLHAVNKLGRGGLGLDRAFEKLGNWWGKNWRWWFPPHFPLRRSGGVGQPRLAGKGLGRSRPAVSGKRLWMVMFALNILLWNVFRWHGVCCIQTAVFKVWPQNGWILWCRLWIQGNWLISLKQL